MKAIAIQLFSRWGLNAEQVQTLLWPQSQRQDVILDLIRGTVANLFFERERRLNE